MYNNDYGPLIGALGALLGLGVFLIIFFFALVIILIVSYWKIFTKAGKPGWAALIPIYNTVVLAEIAGQPWWYGLMPLLAFIPYVGGIVVLIFMILIEYKLALAFGKDTAFVVGLILLPFIFFPILAFSKDAQYTLNQSMQTPVPPPSNPY